MTVDTRAIVQRWIDKGWNKGNMELADELYAPTYTIQGLPPDVPGNLDGLKQFNRAFRAAFPDLHMTVEEMVTEGDRVVWRFTGRGTHQGDFMGIPATHRSITVPGIVITRFEDGRWAEDFALWDQLAMLQQLGVIPVPEQAGV